MDVSNKPNPAPVPSMVGRSLSWDGGRVMSHEGACATTTDDWPAGLRAPEDL